MAKIQIRLKGQSSTLAFGIILVLLVMSLSPAVQAGPQSILDPYANILPPTTTKTESRSFLPKKSAKKQVSNVPQTAANSDETGDYHDPVAKKTTKVKAAKTLGNGPIDKPSASNISSNPGFLSGVKEIQHGYVTSIKAAGQGIVSGGKAAGSKMAAAGHKVISVPKALASKTPLPFAAQQKPTPVVAANPLPTKFNGRSLPGKPLDQIQKPEILKGKDKPLEGEQGNILSHTFGKLNFLNKNKKVQPPANKMTANNINTLPQ